MTFVVWVQLGLPAEGIGQDQAQSVSNAFGGERERGSPGTSVDGGSGPEAAAKSANPHADLSPEKRTKQSLRFEAWRLARRRDLSGVRQLLANMKAGELLTACWTFLVTLGHTLGHPKLSSRKRG